MLQEFIQAVHAALGPNVDWKQVVLTGMAPVFLIVFAVEWQLLRQRAAGGAAARPLPRWRDVATNLGLGASYQVAEFAVHALVSGAVILWIYEHRLFDVPVNAWTIVPIFVAVEFCYYWFHRASHRIRWFWSAHVVHHSEEQMNFTTALRQSMLYSITGWWLFFMPLVWLGVPPGVVFFLYACDLAYQYFVHTEVIGRLPRWYEYVFDTPSNHRAHHGRNPQYIDRNYGGVLIIFDRWFGTYVEEDEPVDYGIPRQVRSNNIWTLNVHEFADMWRDVARPGPLLQRLRHLWAPPEWQRPDDVSASGLSLPQS
ncbi:sterol desaturase family protein [Sinimarinibacterium flocculans]|uniref:Sterol desaturase/sphingolipid hydroxylase (Fatty acid hydroxylase superfamily) n=1 Tax=Sinimarinibacterium flocculans TaxID=985250 RepID=A0A318EG12_9GAMM|nr:sterol desaturase family protein [Sinimarinibacterium flocculans]PXV69656.1 sterol desaturase/sphingolipid hydroxylase (fatty acid hydroxylase superfamily) [Sinimarinibacterium flocculans]